MLRGHPYVVKKYSLLWRRKKEVGQKRGNPFTPSPLLFSPLVTNDDTHPVQGGREAVAADRSESVEWMKRKERGEIGIIFSLYHFLLYATEVTPYVVTRYSPFPLSPPLPFLWHTNPGRRNVSGGDLVQKCGKRKGADK